MSCLMLFINGMQNALQKWVLLFLKMLPRTSNWLLRIAAGEEGRGGEVTAGVLGSDLVEEGDDGPRQQRAVRERRDRPAVAGSGGGGGRDRRLWKDLDLRSEPRGSRGEGRLTSGVKPVRPCSVGPGTAGIGAQSPWITPARK